MRTPLITALSFLIACSGNDAPATPPESAAPPVVVIAAPAEAAVEPGTNAAAVVSPEWKAFGGPFAVAAAQPVKALLDDTAGSAGKVMRVEGTVADVCQKKGCWMVLSDGSRQIRVITKDHAFGIDTDSMGIWADVEGTVVEKPHDADEAAHILSESARPELAPEKAGQPTYQLVATAIRTHR